MKDRIQRLRIMVDDNSTRGGRLFDDFFRSVRGFLAYVETARVAIFTAEYLLRIFVEEK